MRESALKFSTDGHDYSQPLALLWFSANWCGPCQQMNPVMQELAGKYSEQVRVLKIDVDQQAELSADFAIRGVPTLVLLNSDGEIDRQIGSAGLQQLSQWMPSAYSFKVITILWAHILWGGKVEADISPSRKVNFRIFGIILVGDN